ncbi:MAG: glucokinase [Pseudomonadota bacterium]
MSAHSSSVSDCLLVGDIGGTNARFALYDSSGGSDGAGKLLVRQTFAASDFARFTDAVNAFLQRSGVEASQLKGASFAVASPLAGQEIRFTNSPWCFSRESLRSEIGVSRLTLVNDFEALAHGVPRMIEDGLRPLRQGEGDERSPKLVLGPGTGLGVAAILPLYLDDRMIWRPVPGEGGHVAFAPIDDFELDFLKYLQVRHDRVSVERIVCGDGLVSLYHFILARARKTRPEPVTPAWVASEALAGDAIAKDAVMRFLAALGSFAGDCALIYVARGGVYFGGGVLPKIWPLVSDSPLVDRFNSKGRMSPWVSMIPLKLIVDDTVALRGAAIAAEHG